LERKFVSSVFHIYFYVSIIVPYVVNTVMNGSISGLSDIDPSDRNVQSSLPSQHLPRKH